MKVRLSPLSQLTVDRGAPSTMQEQFYWRVREAIADGRLAPGERLPSTRSLATQLNVARGTIDSAYGRLGAEGWLLGRGAAGTVVTPGLDIAALAARRPPAERAPLTPANDHLWPFRGGLPALDLFPRALWTSLAARAARRLDPARMCYPAPQGLDALRVAVTAHLLVSRGVDCDPRQVIVTGGYQAALDIVIRLLLRPGDEAWFEDPGYRFARRALVAAGVELAPLPVDAAGIDVDHGRRHHPGARLAVVTPGHQSPLGVSLTRERRRALLDWASESGGWILEDDYDTEFHYVGNKPPALKSLDRCDRVFHAGSFSKTLFPGLRLGFLVVPEAWVDAAAAACEVAGRGLSAQQQDVVATFLAEGHYARHLRRMRQHYAQRSAALVEALSRRFGDALRLEPLHGGLTLLARLQGVGADVDLVERARARGLAPSALSAHAVRHGAGEGLLLGFTNIAPERADDAACRLWSALAAGPQ